MRRIAFFLRSLFGGLIVGGRWWGYVRLVFAVLLVGFMARLSQMLYSTPGITPPGLFSIRGLRFWVMPLGAFGFALLVGAHYVRDVYELPDFRLGFRYLISSLFSIRQPGLVIQGGRRVLDDDEVNLLDKVGGPGSVSVGPGSVVLLESLHAPSNVYGRGGHYVNRYERVKEIGTLEDQFDDIKSTHATTKDGIRVEIRDIRYSYRLRTGRKLGDYTRRTVEDPFPFSVGAVRNMTYNRSVGPQGITPWHQTVRTTITGVIANYIRERVIDELTAPGFSHEADVRGEIQKELMSQRTRDRLNGLGVDLLWVDVGHFDILPEDVDDQRISTWGARWEGLADVDRAYGEAQEIEFRDYGRAQAQADILIALVDAIGSQHLGNNPQVNLETLILERTAQFLELISEQDPNAMTDPSLQQYKKLLPKKGS